VTSAGEIRHGDGVFFIERDGRRVAELTYRMAGEDVAITYTYVESKLRGGTLAGDLVEAAVQWARADKRKVIPMCSYVRAVFARTPGYADVRK
jgi:predicted GNAT family acetyltransferase